MLNSRANGAVVLIFVLLASLLGAGVGFVVTSQNVGDFGYSYLIGCLSDGRYYARSGVDGCVVDSWTSTNASQVFNNAFSGGTSFSAYALNGQSAVTGYTSKILITNGMYNLSTYITVPVGSCIKLEGQSTSSWLPGSNWLVGDSYYGGVCLYSYDSTGKIFSVPQDGDGKPRTQLDCSNIEFRLHQPASLQDGPMIDLAGWRTGRFDNCLVLASNLTTPNVRYGINVDAGAFAELRSATNSRCFGFTVYGWQILCSHFVGTQLSVGKSSGGTGYIITPQENNVFTSLHCQYITNGVRVYGPNTYGFPVIFNTVHFETVTTPFLGDNNITAKFNQPIFDDTTFTGDITNSSRALVYDAYYQSDPTKTFSSTYGIQYPEFITGNDFYVGGPTSRVMGVIGRLYFTRIHVPIAVNLTRLSYGIGSEYAGNITIGIYTEGDTLFNLPDGGTLVWSSTNTPQTDAGNIMDFAVLPTEILAAGDYWICIEASNTTATYQAYGNINYPYGEINTGGSGQRYCDLGSYTTIPATCPATGASSTISPCIFWLRVTFP